jgi:uncharacterized Zn finger protein
MTANAPELVDPKDGCPRCGERSTDRLVWKDDEHVECHTCGTVYLPGAAKDHDQE